MSTTAVIGLGQLGASVALSLAEHGRQVIAIDIEMRRVDALKDKVTSALCLDATDERALRAAGVAECGTVLLALGEEQLEQAVMTTMLLRDLGVGLIISRAANEVQERVLRRLGVTDVVFPENEIGRQLARRIMTPSVHALMPLTGTLAVAEVDVPPSLAGKTLSQAALRASDGLNVLAVRRRQERASDDGKIIVTWQSDEEPGAATLLGKGDRLYVAATDARIRAFAEK